MQKGGDVRRVVIHAIQFYDLRFWFCRRQEERLAQRRREVVAMDNEISELMWMISLAKRQRVALDEEVLNKKCEMKFLRKECEFR